MAKAVDYVYGVLIKILAVIGAQIDYANVIDV